MIKRITSLVAAIAITVLIARKSYSAYHEKSIRKHIQENWNKYI